MIKVRDMIKELQEDGWYLHDQRGSHKQFKHPTKKGKVTVPDHGKNSDLGTHLEKLIRKQAGL